MLNFGEMPKGSKKLSFKVEPKLFKKLSFGRSRGIQKKRTKVERCSTMVLREGGDEYFL